MRLDAPDGGHLHYEVHGDRGPWLISLNGAMSTTASWLELGDARLFLAACGPLVYSHQFYQRAGDWLAQRTELVAGLLTPEWLRAFVRISRSARTFDFRDDLARVTVPTLLLCGTEDALTSPDHVFAMADHLPSCQTLTIPGAGHGLFVEKPHELITAALGFTAR